MTTARRVPDRARAMTRARMKALCLKFPGATCNIQWGNDLVFKVGGKMFAVVGASGPDTGLSFKAASDSFHILTQLPGIIPAPYLARAQWVKLESLGTLPADELVAYLQRAHAIVAATLPKKMQATLAAAAAKPRPTA